eukprot:75680_1
MALKKLKKKLGKDNILGQIYSGSLDSESCAEKHLHYFETLLLKRTAEDDAVIIAKSAATEVYRLSFMKNTLGRIGEDSNHNPIIVFECERENERVSFACRPRHPKDSVLAISREVSDFVVLIKSFRFRRDLSELGTVPRKSKKRKFGTNRQPINTLTSTKRQKTELTKDDSAGVNSWKNGIANQVAASLNSGVNDVYSGTPRTGSRRAKSFVSRAAGNLPGTNFSPCQSPTSSTTLARLKGLGSGNENSVLSNPRTRPISTFKSIGNTPRRKPLNPIISLSSSSYKNRTVGSLSTSRTHVGVGGYKPSPISSYGDSEGFRNLGNTCYMNSVMQALLSLNCFTNDLVVEPFEQCKAPKESFYRHLLDVLKKKRTPRHGVLDLSSFKENLGRDHARFRGYSQQDAHELVTHLLTLLQEDLGRFFRSLITHKRKPQASLDTSLINLTASPVAPSSISSLTPSTPPEIPFNSPPAHDPDDSSDTDVDMNTCLNPERVAKDAGHSSSSSTEPGAVQDVSMTDITNLAKPDPREISGDAPHPSTGDTISEQPDPGDTSGDVPDPGMSSTSSATACGSDKGEMDEEMKAWSDTEFEKEQSEDYTKSSQDPSESTKTSSKPKPTEELSKSKLSAKSIWEKSVYKRTYGVPNSEKPVALLPNDRNFYAQVELTLTCSSCCHKRIVQEDYYDFSLDFPPPKTDPSSSSKSSNGKPSIFSSPEPPNKDNCNDTQMKGLKPQRQCQKCKSTDRNVKRLIRTDGPRKGQYYFKCMIPEHKFQCGARRPKVPPSITSYFGIEQPPVPLSSMMEYFFRDQQREFKCEKCVNNVVMVKSRITRLPRVLTLHIKRFVPNYRTQSYDKRGSRIRIERTLELSSVARAIASDDQSTHSPPCPLIGDFEKWWSDGEQKHKSPSVQLPNSHASPNGSPQRLNGGGQFDAKIGDPCSTTQRQLHFQPSSPVQSTISHYTMPQNETRNPSSGSSPSYGNFAGSSAKPPKRIPGPAGEPERPTRFAFRVRPEGISAQEERDLQEAIELSKQTTPAYVSRPPDESLSQLENDEKFARDLQAQMNADVSDIADGDSVEKPGPSPDSTRYVLQAVVHHLGRTPSSGHYICDAFDSEKNRWRRYNDSIVNTINTAEVLGPESEKTAYLFFFLHEAFAPRPKNKP